MSARSATSPPRDAAHRGLAGRLVIATYNPGKLKEMRELLGLVEPVENGATFKENARIKASAAAKASGLPAFADDSGLTVDALDGDPGIYSARWAGPKKDFRRAMQIVEDKLRERGARARSQRAAHFVSALCLAWPDGHIEEFEATARSCGRRAARRVSATIRCSCPPAIPAPSAR